MKNLYRHTSIVAVCAVLASCATQPPEELLAPIEAPAEWTSLSDATSAGSDQPLPLNWVESFADPTLNSLILEAMNNNNDLGASAARVRAARQGFRQVLSGALPQVSASVRGNRDDDTGEGFSIDPTAPPVPGSITNFTFNLSGSWEADVWGRLSDSARAAYRDAAAASLDFDGARLSIAGNVTIGWYNLVSARLQRELAERDVETGEANLRITERRYERGVSSSLDVRLARSSLATSKASLISRQQTELEAKRSLEVLLGRYPAAELTTAEELPALASIANAEGIVVGLGTPESLLDKRPDVLAAENRLKAEGLRERAALKAFLPSFRVAANGIASADEFDNLVDVDDLIGSIALTITQQIFAGGRLDAQKKQQRALVEQSAYNYVSTVLSAYQEVENAIAAETLLAAREDALKLAFEEARASEELTERQYINGTRNIFNLIQAQQRRISNEAQYITARQQRLINRVQLYMALGGTFDVGEEKFVRGKTNVVEEDDMPLFSRWWTQVRGDRAEDTTAVGAE
ncbi:efflux transporter outer membrane subunit [Parvularcula sp. IMCC14364]|uniref:efflux transporter outer membrane subunit n=1 Tax=Parvularcula sp. IMCC14364 TaxID=3067902 RepID=UPI00274050A5|nr:TolC family protein [Parvularcula sp. IMCC14364]